MRPVIDTIPLRRIVLAGLFACIVQASEGIAADGRNVPVDAGGSGTERIISLSPSTTEIIFALGLEDLLVGVTRYCTFPPEAGEKTDVGGYLDPNFEAIAALEPDVVILLPEHDSIERFLDELGIGHMTVDNKRVDDILDAIETLGNRFGAQECADSIIGDIRGRIESIRERSVGQGRPTVLVAVGRSLGEGTLREVYIAGPNTYFDELLTLAGGTNAYRDEKVPYPTITAEGIMTIDPEVVIDVVTGYAGEEHDDERLLEDWRNLPSLSAVKRNRIYFVREDYANIPGPRFIMMLETVFDMIHPGAGKTEH